MRNERRGKETPSGALRRTENRVSPETKVAVHVDGRTLTLTNLAKVLYPQTGFTKAEVLDYYQRVANVLLPHITGRPLTLKRYPEGVDGEAFFQKHVTEHRPDWIRTAKIPSDSSRGRGTTVTYLVVDDLPALIWAANLAGLELHVPQWRMPELRLARPAGLRPGSRSPRQHRGLLPGGGGPAAAAGGRGLRGAGQDLRRQGPAAVRPDLRRDLRAGQRPGPRLRRTARTRSAAPGGVADDQGAAHRQGPHRLEPEQRVQDHRRPLLAARPAEPHGLDPGQLGRGARLPAPGGTVLHRRRGPGPGGGARRPVRAAAPVTVR